MRDDGDEVRARALELAEALRRLPFEGVERRLVDGERGLVRQRADEADLLLLEFDVVGDLEDHRAEEPVADEERQRDVVERDDGPSLRERAVSGLCRGTLRLSRPRALADLVVLAQVDRAARARIHPDQAIHDEREHLVELERGREDVRDLEERRHLA